MDLRGFHQEGVDFIKGTIMTAKFRNYQPFMDFEAVSRLLIKYFQPHNRDGNWFQAAWEYMHCHPCLDETKLTKIGIWEENDEIVGVATYESVLGEVFFQIHPAYEWLKPEMLAYAETELTGINKAGRRYVEVYVNDFDVPLETFVREHGYVLLDGADRPMSEFAIPDPFPSISVPDGFRLQSLADENDLAKIDRVLHRGFNHKGEPPEDGVEGRRKMQSGSNFRKDLNIVVRTSEGHFVAYAGTWYDPVNRFAYVEPVATDPDYRRMGLGKAAVLEGIRRCANLGATTAYVGSDLQFYVSIGFKKIYTCNSWVKYFDD
jgi:predicted N-acetyltransferase YhbS